MSETAASGPADNDRNTRSANRRLPDSAESPSWPMGLRLTCSAAPVQVEGPIDGGYVYFRARLGWWQIAIGATCDEAVEATIDGAEPPVCFEGESDCGYGDLDEARRIIAEYAPQLRRANR